MATEPKVSKGRALEILGLTVGASKDDIKRAYKNLAREWHPDKNSQPNATEKFQELSTAYRTLITHDNRIGPNDSFGTEDGDWSSGSDDEDYVYYFDDRELFFILLQDLLFRRRFSYTRGPFDDDHSQDSNYFRPRQREAFNDQYDAEHEKWEKQPKPSSWTYQQEEHASNKQSSSQTGFSRASTSYSRRYDQGNDEEDAELYDFLKRERTEGDDEDLDPDEVVKKYKSYEEWKKAKKQKKKLKLPPKPRPLSKRQQQNQQFRRDKEMQEIQAELIKMNLEKEEKEKTRREKEEIKKLEEEEAEVERRKQAATEKATIPEHREKKEEKKKKTSKRREMVIHEENERLMERQRELERQRNLTEQQQIQAAEAERRRNTITHRTNQAHQHQYGSSSTRQQNFNSSHHLQGSVNKRNPPPASKSHDSAPYCRNSSKISPKETPRPPACNAWAQGPPSIPTADGTLQAKVPPLVPAPNTPEEEEEMLRRALELSMKEQIEEQEYLLNQYHNAESEGLISDGRTDSWSMKNGKSNGWDQGQLNSGKMADNGFSQKKEKDNNSATSCWDANDSNRLQGKQHKVQIWPTPEEENWDEEDVETLKCDVPVISTQNKSCDWAVTGARPKSTFHSHDKTKQSKLGSRGRGAKSYLQTRDTVKPMKQWDSNVIHNEDVGISNNENEDVSISNNENEDVSKSNDEYVEDLGHSADKIQTDEVSHQILFQNNDNLDTGGGGDKHLQFEFSQNLCSEEWDTDDLPQVNEVADKESLVPGHNIVGSDSLAGVPTPIYNEQFASEQSQMPSLSHHIAKENAKLQIPSNDPLSEQPDMSQQVISFEQSHYFNSENSQMPRVLQHAGVQYTSELGTSHGIKVNQTQPENTSQFDNEQHSSMPNYIPISHTEHDLGNSKVNVSTATGFNDGQPPPQMQNPFPDNKVPRMFYEQGGNMGLPFVGAIPNIGMMPIPGMYNPYMPGASNPLLSVAYMQSMNMMYGGLPPPLGGLPQLSPFPGIAPVHVNPFVNYAFPFPQVNNLVPNSNIANMRQGQEKISESSSVDEPSSTKVPSESSQTIPSVASFSDNVEALNDMTYQSDDESESEVFFQAAPSECRKECSPPVDCDNWKEEVRSSTAVNSKHLITVPGTEHDSSLSSHLQSVVDNYQLPPTSTAISHSHSESNSVDSNVNMYAKPFPSANGRGNPNPVRLRGCLRARGARRTEPFSHQQTAHSMTQSATNVHTVCNNPRAQFKSPFYEAEDTRARRTKNAVAEASKSKDRSYSKKGGHS